MILSAIVAVSPAGAIGCNGTLPWPCLKDDMKWFRRYTLGKPVIMGRKTWDSLGGKPLLGRANIVLSRSGINPFSCDFASWRRGEISLWTSNLEKATALAIVASNADTPEAVVIGGGQVYRLLWSQIRRVYCTRVHVDVPDADTWFPKMSLEEWKLVQGSSVMTGDIPSGIDLDFAVWERM